MRRIRLPKNFYNWKNKYIVFSDRAIVAQIRMPGHPAHGLVARTTIMKPGRPEKPPRIMFHEIRLAKKLFPSNFIKVVGVSPARFPFHGSILLSQKVRLDKLSEKVLELYYKGDRSLRSKQKVFTNPDYCRHGNRVSDVAIPIAKRMEQEGILVNTNPANVWFTEKGVPIFFDITKIDAKKIAKNHRGKIVRESTKFLINQEVKNTSQKAH